VIGGGPETVLAQMRHIRDISIRQFALSMPI